MDIRGRWTLKPREYSRELSETIRVRIVGARQMIARGPKKNERGRTRIDCGRNKNDRNRTRTETRRKKSERVRKSPETWRARPRAIRRISVKARIGRPRAPFFPWKASGPARF